MRLSEVCEIQPGYHRDRASLKPSKTGGLKGIRRLDIAVRGQVEPAKLTQFELSDVPKHYHASGGDVVFDTRGRGEWAFVIDEAWDEIAVVIHPLLLLRPRLDLIEPRYLAWAINQAPSQRHLNKFTYGNAFRRFSTTHFEKLVINVPNFKRQRAIVEITNLTNQQQRLSAIRLEKERNLLNLISKEQGQKQPRSRVRKD